MKSDIQEVLKQIKKGRYILDDIERNIEINGELKSAESTKAHITQVTTHLKEAKKAIGDHN